MQDYPDYQVQNEPFSTRVYHFIQDVWPAVYNTVNSLFFGTINFIKDTISGIWRR